MILEAVKRLESYLAHALKSCSHLCRRKFRSCTDRRQSSSRGSLRCRFWSRFATSEDWRIPSHGCREKRVRPRSIRSWEEISIIFKLFYDFRWISQSSESFAQPEVVVPLESHNVSWTEINLEFLKLSRGKFNHRTEKLMANDVCRDPHAVEDLSRMWILIDEQELFLVESQPPIVHRL